MLAASLAVWVQFVFILLRFDPVIAHAREVLAYEEIPLSLYLSFKIIAIKVSVRYFL